MANVSLGGQNFWGQNLIRISLQRASERAGLSGTCFLFEEYACVRSALVAIGYVIYMHVRGGVGVELNPTSDETNEILPEQ